MNFNVSKKIVSPNAKVYKVGDQVKIAVASSATMNLYEKAKSKGLSFLKCPCGVPNTSTLEIVKPLGEGFMLRVLDSGVYTAALAKDLRG